MTDEKALQPEKAEPEPVAPEQAAPEAPVEEWDKERAAKTIKAQREEAKALKDRLKKLEALEAEDARRKEAELTELQRAQARAEKAEAEAATLRLSTLRRQVADEVGLPPALADRLQGATQEEMTEDAKKLLEVLPKEQPKPKYKATNPGEQSVTESLENIRKRREAARSNPFDPAAARQLGGGVIVPKED